MDEMSKPGHIRLSHLTQLGIGVHHGTGRIYLRLEAESTDGGSQTQKFQCLLTAEQANALVEELVFALAELP